MAEQPEPRGNGGLPENFEWGKTPVTEGLEQQFGGSMASESVGLHEIYLCHLQAGFQPQQALYLLATQISGHPGIAPDGAREQPE